MPFWRKRMEAEVFGGHLLWEFAKYGKGAEAGLTELLEGGVELVSVDQRLRDANVAVTTRQRYQLFFTALMGQLAFHSLKEKRLEQLRAGFESEFPRLNEELAGILGCPPGDLAETHRFSELAAGVIRRNPRFQQTGDLLNSTRGVEGSLCEELGLLLLHEALADCVALEKGVEEADRKYKCLQKIALSMLAAYDEGAVHYKQYKLT